MRQLDAATVAYAAIIPAGTGGSVTTYAAYNGNKGRFWKLADDARYQVLIRPEFDGAKYPLMSRIKWVASAR